MMKQHGNVSSVRHDAEGEFFFKHPLQFKKQIRSQLVEWGEKPGPVAFLRGG